jgi:hypothetical protein
MKKMLFATLFLICAHANADCDVYVNNHMMDEVSVISPTIFKLDIIKLTEPGIEGGLRFYYVGYIPGDANLKDAKWFVVAKELANGQCNILSANRISNSF